MSIAAGHKVACYNGADGDGVRVSPVIAHNAYAFCVGEYRKVLIRFCS